MLGAFVAFWLHEQGPPPYPRVMAEVPEAQVCLAGIGLRCEAMGTSGEALRTCRRHSAFPCPGP